MTAWARWIPWLGSRWPGDAAASPPSGPDGKRLYVLGDIHGRADLLGKLHARIADDIEAHPQGDPLVVYLGDYVDRGPDSRGVLETLSTSSPRDAPQLFLRGNHEQAMLDFLGDPLGGAAWLEFGGIQTLASYGVEAAPPWSPDVLERMAVSLWEALPDHHRRFLRGLSLFQVLGDYLFAHAGIRPGIPPERQAAEDILYIGEPFLSSLERHPFIIVHGHHVTAEPDMRHNRIGIDTGAFATGRLTCLVLDGTDRAFLST